MGMEKINRITIKNDGVYISHKSANCSEPFRSQKNESLTNILNNKGKKELTKEFIKMFCEYCQPVGKHKSIIKYKRLLTNSCEAAIFKRNYIDFETQEYSKLSKEDRESCWSLKTTENYKKYVEKMKKARNKLYENLYNIYNAMEG